MLIQPTHASHSTPLYLGKSLLIPRKPSPLYSQPDTQTPTQPAPSPAPFLPKTNPYIFDAVKYIVGGTLENSVRVPLSNIGGKMQNAAQESRKAGADPKWTSVANSPLSAAKHTLKGNGGSGLYYTLGISNAVRPVQRVGAFGLTSHMRDQGVGTSLQATAVAGLETALLTPIETIIKKVTGVGGKPVSLKTALQDNAMRQRMIAGTLPSFLRNYTFLIPFLYGKDTLQEQIKKHPIAVPTILAQGCVVGSHIFELWQTRICNLVDQDIITAKNNGTPPRGLVKLTIDSAKEEIAANLSKEGLLLSSRSLAVRGGSVGIGFSIIWIWSDFVNQYK